MSAVQSIEELANGPQGLSVETVEQPDGPRAPLRVNRRLETAIRVESGVMYVIAGDDETVLMPGDEQTIPAGVAYRRWNAGDSHARFVESYRPARPARAVPRLRPAWAF